MADQVGAVGDEITRIEQHISVIMTDTAAMARAAEVGMSEPERHMALVM